MIRALLPLLLVVGLAGCARHGATVPDGMRRCHGVNLPESVVLAGTELSLNGMAVRDTTIFDLDVYVGALYLQHPSRDAAAIVEANEPRRIVLRFIRGVTRQDIVNAWESGFINNSGTERLGLTDEIARFEAMFEDVDDEAEMTFDYVPGVGTTYSLDGVARGTIAGAEFGRAFLRVFLGNQPPSRELREGLLGGPCD